jgi:NADH-quinone oxidoreductase subunit J/NAD(P)H-quinone oxidoreductase subunit 6
MIGAVGAAGALLVEIIVAIGLKAGGTLSHAKVSEAFGSPAAIGKAFLTDHLLAFEITSIVLLVAALGGVVLGSYARRQHWGAAEPPARESRPVKAGAEVPPADRSAV